MTFRVTNGMNVKELSKKLSDKNKVIDPVCDMEVKEGIIKTDYKGQTYSFCSEYCRTKFTREPFKYVGR